MKKKDYVSNYRNVKRKLRRTTTTNVIHDTNSMFGKKKKNTKRDKYLWRLGKKDLPILGTTTTPTRPDWDSRQCPDCCVMVCGEGYVNAGSYHCTCYNDGSYQFDGSCLSGASLPGGYSSTEEACEFGCADGGTGNFAGGTTNCYCTVSRAYCDEQCYGGSGGCLPDNPPAECPDNYEPQWTAGGMPVYVPGCAHPGRDRSGGR